MNIHGKGASNMTVEEAIARGAAIMAEMEADADKHCKYAEELRGVVQTVHDAGHIGALENAALGMEIDALTCGYRAGLYVYHSKTTLRAQAEGIDLPLRDGGR